MCISPTGLREPLRFFLQRLTPPRSILLEHSIRYASNAKKAELVELFTTQLLPRAGSILAADSRVRPSAHGIVAVSSETGDERPVVTPPSTGVKRGRKPKKASEPAPEPAAAETEAEADVEPAPPAKRPRGRPRKTVEAPATPAPVVDAPPVPQFPSGFLAPAPPSAPASARKRVLKNEPIVDIPLSPARQRAQRSVSGVTPSSPAPPSSSSRRKSERPSVSTASDSLAPPVPEIPAHLASPSKRKAKAEPEVQEEPVAPTPRKVGRPRKSVKAADIKEERSEPEEAPAQDRRISKGRRSDADADESGFSDFNPFQSGSGEAADRERRRRKVSSTRLEHS